MREGHCWPIKLNNYLHQQRDAARVFRTQSYAEVVLVIKFACPYLRFLGSPEMA